ncbi:MAG: hypothetical protein AVDCRST_MAG79-158 [uncultured Thermoleophilia bacterium]|uniref:Uncharacterized protein n=1 Tax=uncultured Thermoleophilia bacterium TaxID=1497501 RepID=A0A6J4TD95_9ACTN|nr:MAG: hypothetical protein AVDCRST_MAG79-158 [uncultured Thermoleophilia bacterium]
MEEPLDPSRTEAPSLRSPLVGAGVEKKKRIQTNLDGL